MRGEVVEVEKEEGGEAGNAGLGDLERHDPASRTDGSGHLRKCLIDVGHVAEGEADSCAVEAIAGHGEAFRLAGHHQNPLPDAELLQLLVPDLHHRQARVYADRAPGLADHLEGEVARADRDVQGEAAGGKAALARGEPAPSVVLAEA